MNLKEFEVRYELIDCVTDGNIESYHALHRSGVVVMAHFVSGTPELRESVGLAAERLRSADSDNQILESHVVDGRLVIVTRFLRDFESLEAWLASRGLPLGSEGTGPTEAGIPAFEEDSLDASVGEFTSMFMAGGADTPLGDSVAPEGPAPPPRDPGPSEPPGEFTAMFMAGGQEASGSDPADPLPGAQEPPDPPGEPGYGVLSGRDTEPAMPAEPDAPEEAGEFTQMFRAAGAGEGVDAGLPSLGADGPVGEGYRPPPVRAPAEPPAPPPSGDVSRASPASPGARPADPFAPPPKEETAEFDRFFRPAEKPDAGSATEPSLDWSDAPVAGRRREPQVPPTPASDPNWAEALRGERPQSPRPSPSSPSGPVDEVPAEQGEFTQIFGAELPPMSGGVGTPASPGGERAAPTPSGTRPPPHPPASPPVSIRPPRALDVPLSDPEALIRQGPAARPRPPRFRAPGGRESARMGARAASTAAQGAMGKSEAADSDDPSTTTGQRSGLSSATFAIALVVILVLTVGVVGFFSVWDFGGATVEGDTPVTDSVAVDPAGPAG